jgi:hypothetical protein
MLARKVQQVHKGQQGHKDLMAPSVRQDHKEIQERMEPKAQQELMGLTGPKGQQVHKGQQDHKVTQELRVQRDRQAHRERMDQ